jgi:hypothetical protein
MSLATKYVVLISKKAVHVHMTEDVQSYYYLSYYRDFMNIEKQHTKFKRELHNSSNTNNSWIHNEQSNIHPDTYESNTQKFYNIQFVKSEDSLMPLDIFQNRIQS